MAQGSYQRTARHLEILRAAASKRRKYPYVQTSDVFGSWTVVEKRNRKNGHQMWLCRCVCGMEKETSETHLRRSASTKCLRCSGRANFQKALNSRLYRPNRRNESVGIRVQALYDSQKGVCPLCGKQLPELSKCAWDHDHVSGEGRALLHKGCNVFLGFIERSPERLGRVIKYCETYNIKIV